MIDNKKQKDSNKAKLFGKSFISGGCAGMIAKTVVAPVERLKIIYQVTSEKLTYKSMFEKSVKLYKQNGPTTFWRGNLVNIGRIFPLGAIQFGVFDS